MKRFLALFLTICLLAGLFAGCAAEPSVPEPETGNVTPVPTAEPEPENYTLTVLTDSVTINFNPHTAEAGTADSLLSCLLPGLTEAVTAEDGRTVWTYELAESVEDVTASYAGRQALGITEAEGRIYRIRLNPDACWEDGTPITAEDYVASMQLLLDPALANPNAERFCTGGAAPLLHARNYRLSEDVSFTPLGQTAAEYAAAGGAVDTLFIDVYAFWHAEGYQDENGNAAPRYVSVTDETVYDCRDEQSPHYLNDAFSGASLYTDYLSAGQPYADYSAEYVGFCGAPVTWADVGLMVEDPQTLIFVCETPVAYSAFCYALSANWLVNTALYTSLQTAAEDGSTVTAYGTDAASVVSCGPYTLTAAELGESLVLEKNDRWYGWTDGRHDEQYQTTRIVCRQEADPNVRLELYYAGEADVIPLADYQYAESAHSENLLTVPSNMTLRFVFASDLTALTALEAKGDGTSKRILAYPDFRRAFSLALDRSRLCAEGARASVPAAGLLNDLYYYDFAHDPASVYRQSPEAVSALCAVYSVDASADCTQLGYAPELARTLFASAYASAVADGNYEDGQPILLRIAVSEQALTEADLWEEALLNAMLAEATAGTPLEGLLSVEYVGEYPGRYEAVAAGEIEMIRGGWSGDVFSAAASIRVYSSVDTMGSLSAIAETCGWNPAAEGLSVTADFGGTGKAETRTASFNTWANAINDPALFAGDAALCLSVLSQLEAGILGTWQCVPYAVPADALLISSRISVASSDYGLLTGFGGIRGLTYAYSDADWAEQVNIAE